MKNKIIKELIRLIEDSKLKVRGGRGFATGHPYQEKEIQPIYGKSEYDANQEEIPVDNTRVKISKAYLDQEADET